jgi:hypothetical protein
MIKTDYYVLYENCRDYHDAIDRAYALVRDNYEIIEDWFEAQGRKGKKFAKHFDGRTKTRIKCKDMGVDARGVPTGMELDTTRLNRQGSLDAATTVANQSVCLDIDLAAVILHETHHLGWRGGERTAWSLEAWWRAKITAKLGLAGTTYCNHPVTDFPPDGKYKGMRLKAIKLLVREAF